MTDDTAAIQAAIDATVARGGGKITFPYTPKGYRIASPGKATCAGRPCRAQLCLPAKTGVNIAFEGQHLSDTVEVIQSCHNPSATGSRPIGLR